MFPSPLSARAQLGFGGAFELATAQVIGLDAALRRWTLLE